MSLNIGDIVVLKTNCLGNPPGTYGFVFNDYWLSSNHHGVDVIFQNMNYDGFSDEDCDIFLSFVCRINSDYFVDKIQKYTTDTLLFKSDEGLFTEKQIEKIKNHHRKTKIKNITNPF